MSGSLRDRLNRSLSHNPEMGANARSKCQLHRWARGRDGSEVRGKGVMKCSACKVFLCTSCWKTFHEENDLLGEKANIAK
jgi:hypothetical protein